MCMKATYLIGDILKENWKREHRIFQFIQTAVNQRLILSHTTPLHLNSLPLDNSFSLSNSCSVNKSEALLKTSRNKWVLRCFWNQSRFCDKEWRYRISDCWYCNNGTSGQSNLTKGRTAAVHGWRNRFASPHHPSCTPWAIMALQLRWQTSEFAAVRGHKSAGMSFPPKLAPLQGTIWPRSNTWFFGPKSTT